jgi:uncharacterized Zn finger protein
MKPLGKKQKTLDLSKADTLQCDKCDNYLFITSFVIKRISAIMSPNGQEGLVPVQVYSCGNCGQVPKSLLEGSGLGTDV